MSNLPGPEQAEAFALPTDDRVGLHYEGAGFPVLPDSTEPSPQESIGGRQFWSLYGALQDADLMAQGENLQLKRGTAPNRGGKRSEEGREQRPEWQSDEERQLSF